MAMARQSEPSVPVLVTRPKAEGEAFAALLVTRCGQRVRPVVTPLLAPRFLNAKVPARDYAAVIFTSAQAVAGARRLGIALPHLAWCVGRKTAEVAVTQGFMAKSGNGDVEALAEAIIADPPNGRILYLRGVDTRGNLLEKLNSFGIYTDAVSVYAQDPQPLSGAALSILRSPVPVVVPLFSPRTASLFAAALPADPQAGLHIAAMSAAVAEAVGTVPCAALRTASRPDMSAMLDAVESLLADLPAP